MFPASILTHLQNGLRTPASIDFWEQYKQWTPASNLECKRRALAKVRLKIRRETLSYLVPFGNLLQFALENGPVEIVDLPMKHGDFPIEIVDFPIKNGGYFP